LNTLRSLLNLKVRVILLFLLLFLVLSTYLLVVYGFIRNREAIIQTYENQFINEYRTIQGIYGDMADSIYHLNINTPDILSLLAVDPSGKDEARDNLYHELSDLYRQIQKYNFRQLHFHEKDNHSLLRFHRPDKYGDDLTGVRYSVEYVNRNREYISGFEEGRIFNGFRYVYPLEYGDEHIGSVEISISMKTVIDRLHDLFGKRVQFILKREVVEEKVFDDELENYVPWKPDERFVLDRAIAETSIFSDEFCSEYGDKLREMLTDHIDSQVPFSLTVRFENEKSLLNFIPVENFQGRTVGWLFSLNSHDSLEREIDRFILISVVFFVLTVILVLFSLYYFSTQKRIETMAIYDSLTGCYSRIVVMDRLRGEDDRFQRYETPYSMIMLDIDKFKSVNDQYGHLTGDEVIKSIVWLAGNHIRKSDILGRYGGEEFIVVLPHTPPGERR
jgi:GGDEF domain-containing protein